MFELFGSPTGFALVLAFIVFLIAVRAVLKFALRLMFIAAAAVAFPFVANAVGLGVPTDLGTILSFVIVGVIASVVLSILGWLKR